MGKYVNLENAAKEYGLTHRHLRSLCVKGEVRASKIGRKWLVKPENLDRFFERNSNDGNKKFNR
jgi:excisionase family DNA binding protein